jgi:hypothetical protein
MPRYSRFLFSSSAYAASKGTVKPDAFINPPHVQVSISETEGENETRVWEMGEEVGNGRRNVKARGDFNHMHVAEAGLEIELAPPPPYHRHLIGWGSAEKQHQILKAIKLAKNVTLVVKP